jgi:hypothetical protein
MCTYMGPKLLNYPNPIQIVLHEEEESFGLTLLHPKHFCVGRRWGCSKEAYLSGNSDSATLQVQYTVLHCIKMVQPLLILQ